ncbi:MAG: DUF167 domain-containing protein [Archaeoglobaceae archaeon]
MLYKAVKVRDEGITVDVDVTPGAKKREIGYDEWKNVITVKVKNPPKKGKANNEVIKSFKEFLGREIEIIAGHTSSRKVILVHNASQDEVIKKLEENIKNND